MGCSKCESRDHRSVYWYDFRFAALQSRAGVSCLIDGSKAFVPIAMFDASQLPCSSMYSQWMIDGNASAWNFDTFDVV